MSGSSAGAKANSSAPRSGMWQAGAGLALALAGTLKAVSHWNDPFMQAWCRPAAGGSSWPELFAVVGGEPLLLGHCWGCYAAALGITVAARAGWKAAVR